MKPMLKMALTDSYKAVVDNHVDHLFKVTGTKEEAIWVSQQRYEFELYGGEELAQDPVLGPVLDAARLAGYALKRKNGNELRQEIVILLKEAITVGGASANAWYVKKSQASSKWISIGQHPLIKVDDEEAQVSVPGTLIYTTKRE